MPYLTSRLSCAETVPGGTAAAASIQYREMKEDGMHDLYYGRVIRKGGYIILHYLYFYVMNDWRSGFFGVNDHEADWEQVFVYLSDEGENPPIPRWAAYASHDFKGDDLRRRWDDPELELVGNHPVIYAGAGSHGSYFQKGEYLMQVAPDFLNPLLRVFKRSNACGVTCCDKARQRQFGRRRRLYAYRLSIMHAAMVRQLAWRRT